MRIFYAADPSPGPAAGSQIWRRNIFAALVDLGHEVIEFDYDLRETFRNLDPAKPEQARFIAENRPKLTDALFRQIESVHAVRRVDLFFSYFYDACVSPEALDKIRALGIGTVNWYCNASYQLHLVAEIAPHYDWCLVPEKFRLEDYRRLGARPIYCQEAANPAFYRPLEVPRDLDVTFIGQAYGDRPAHIAALRAAGIDVRVWGAQWEYYAEPEPRSKIRQALGKLKRGALGAGREAAAGASGNAVRLPREIIGSPVSDEEMVRTFNRSKINLGFATCGETHLAGERIVQIRLRDFEVPMSGGFYLTEDLPELEEFFEVGKEIACYASVDDLVDKIRFYLTNESARETIRRAGYERCVRDHTWQRRLTAAFHAMGMGPSS